MKKCLASCLLMFIFLQARAQLGFTVASTFSSTPDWQVVVENYVARQHVEFLRYGTTANVDYTFTLKNEALRFQPALHYVRSSWGSYPHYFEVYALGVQGNMNFALLPATNGDGKPAPFRPFLQLAPGLDVVWKKYDAPVGGGGSFEGQITEHRDRSLAFHASASLLLEFRLSSLMTLSPLAGIRYYPKLGWKNFTEVVSDGSMDGTFDRTHWRQFMLGLRIGLDL